MISLKKRANPGANLYCYLRINYALGIINASRILRIACLNYNFGTQACVD